MYPVYRNSQRLALRELTLADVLSVHAIYGDPRATEHLSFTPRSQQEVREIVERSMASAQQEPRSEYAVAVVGTDDALIGFGRLALDPHQPRAATFGFALRPDFWGHGYGLETVQLLLALGFEDLRLHRIWGARSPCNEASARTMNNVGMVEEGRIREHVNKNGIWRDSIVHAILEREWRAA